MAVTIERACADDEPLVQAIFERSPTYFLRTDGTAVGADFARREMHEMPTVAKRSPSYEKVFCLVRDGGRAIGVVDLHRDHPEAGIAYIGLLLIDETLHGRGLGRAAYLATELYVRDVLRCPVIRLGVSRANDVEAFWARLGFARNGHAYQWTGGGHVNEVFEMEKRIGAAAE